MRTLYVRGLVGAFIMVLGCVCALRAQDTPPEEQRPQGIERGRFVESLRRWLELTPEQEARLRELHERRQKQMAGERRSWRDRPTRFYSLPPEEQKRLREECGKYLQLTPEQVAKLERFRAHWHRIPEERRHWFAYRMQQLAPEKRQELWQKLRELKDLPPDEKRERAREILREYLGPPPPLPGRPPRGPEHTE